MTKGWIDLVFKGTTTKQAGRRICMVNLNEDRARNRIKEKEYNELKQYIFSK